MTASTAASIFLRPILLRSVGNRITRLSCDPGRLTDRAGFREPERFGEEFEVFFRLELTCSLRTHRNTRCGDLILVARRLVFAQPVANRCGHAIRRIAVGAA